MQNEKRAYELGDYTDQGVLRVPPALWLVILYLCRQPAILLLAGVSSLVGSRRGLDLSGLEVLRADPLLLAGALPALAVLGAAARRIPTAGSAARLVWRQGRWLLIGAAAADLAIHLLLGPGLARLALADLAPLLIDLYLVAYLLLSRRSADTFTQFPAPPEG